MTSVPRVSIIMNCYNSSQFLASAIESVLAQSIGDFEVIFWDNCSTDSSAEVFLGFSDSRFRYFRSPDHAPLGKARNLAAQQACGEWLAFLDCDDVWLPTKLERQMAAITSAQNGLVYGYTTVLIEADAQGTRMGAVASIQSNLHTGQQPGQLPSGDVALLLIQNNFIPLSSLCIRRATFLEIGGFKPHLHIVEDYDLVLRAAQKTKVAAVQELCCRYRIHSSNSSQGREIEAILENIEVLTALAPNASVPLASLIRRQLCRHRARLALHRIRSRQFASALGLLRVELLPSLAKLVYVNTLTRVRGLATRGVASVRAKHQPEQSAPTTVGPVRLAMYESYPMGHGGGNHRTQLYIVKELDRRKVLPLVMSPADTPFINRLRNMGVDCEVVSPPESINRFAGQMLRDTVWARAKSAIDLLRYNIRVAKVLRQCKVDVLYCNSIRAVLLAGLGGRLAGVPVIWYVKGALENPLLDRMGFYLSDRILFFCEANRDDKYPSLVRRHGHKIDIVRIGLDIDTIESVERSDRTALADELGIAGGQINALILAQVYPPKGHHLVLENLRSIVDEFPNFRLFIAGDHVLDEYRWYRKDLERRIEREGLQHHVRFLGWRPDALAIASLMDMLIHPSLAEGFGRAVLESMALGRPVVASAVGGLREAIRDGENGFLVAPGDADALADRIRLLAREPERRARFGRAAKDEVYRNYQIRDKVRELEQIWLRAAAR